MTSQKWNPKRYDASANYVSNYGLEVVDFLKPKPGGC
jgi:hypothetical protein